MNVLRADLCNARMQEHIRTECLIHQLLSPLKQRIQIHLAERELRDFRNELPTKCC